MGIFDSLRRGQLIVPFGIGAMIDLPDETLMTAGLDVWPSEYRTNAIAKEAIISNTIIRDERLEKRLSKLLKKDIEYFLSPTQGIDPLSFSEPKYHQHMRFYRFPTWLQCPRCKVLKQFQLNHSDLPRCDNKERLKKGNAKTCYEINRKYRPIMKPVRFLIACKDGHIDDFPWANWVHQGSDCNGGSRDIYITSSARANLSGVKVECKKCGKDRSMAAAVNPKNIIKVLNENRCSGRKPWLGNVQNEMCSSEDLPQLVLRSSSSIYFANTESSILIPPYSKAINVFLDTNYEIWTNLKNILDTTSSRNGDEGEFQVNQIGKELIRKTAERTRFDEDIFIETVINKYNNISVSSSTEDVDDEKFRFKEYLAFTSENRPDIEDRDDFDIYPCDLNDYEEWMTEYFTRIVRVEKLKETRAFTGFSRIIPRAPEKQKVQISVNEKNWLPAIEIRGEGIFLEFNLSKIEIWNNKFLNFGAGKKLNERIRNILQKGKPNFTRRSSVDNKMMLVHTFAHIFIRQLAFECGYDASSLKERLFVGKDDDLEMCGVLIYTASGDSEGSLGGLVDRARPGLLESTIKAALEDTSVCSNDPVCHETVSQGLQGFNVSACHACVLLPETSCEHNNLLLDRRCIIGTFDNPEVGYFSDLLDGT